MDDYIRYLLSVDDPVVRGTLASLDLARIPACGVPDPGAPHVGPLVEKAFALSRELKLRNVSTGVMLLAACQSRSDLVQATLRIDAAAVEVLTERLTRALQAFEGGS